VGGIAVQEVAGLERAHHGAGGGPIQTSFPGDGGVTRAFVFLYDRALGGVKHEELRVRQPEGAKGPVDGSLPAHGVSPASEASERALPEAWWWGCSHRRGM
jgi:hypothetical protein